MFACVCESVCVCVCLYVLVGVSVCVCVSVRVGTCDDGSSSDDISTASFPPRSDFSP